MGKRQELGHLASHTPDHGILSLSWREKGPLWVRPTKEYIRNPPCLRFCLLQVSLYPLPRRVKLGGSMHRELVSAGCFQLYRTGRCYNEHCYPIRSQSPYILPQYGDGEEICSSNGSEVLLFMHNWNSYKLFSAEASQSVDGSCNGCLFYASCGFGFSLPFLQFSKGTISRTEQLKKRICPHELLHHLLHENSAVKNDADVEKLVRNNSNLLEAALWLVTVPFWITPLRRFLPTHCTQ